MKSVLWLTLLLGACAAPAPPPARIVTITPAVPDALLSCAAPPEVPVTTSQEVVARYIVSLWQAGQDCRAHVGAIRQVLAR